MAKVCHFACEWCRFPPIEENRLHRMACHVQHCVDGYFDLRKENAELKRQLAEAPHTP